MGDHTIETKPQGRVGKMSCMNLHKGNLRSQLSIIYIGSFTQTCPHPNDLPEQVDMDALK